VSLLARVFSDTDDQTVVDAETHVIPDPDTTLLDRIMSFPLPEELTDWPEEAEYFEEWSEEAVLDEVVADDSVVTVVDDADKDTDLTVDQPLSDFAKSIAAILLGEGEEETTTIPELAATDPVSVVEEPVDYSAPMPVEVIDEPLPAVEYTIPSVESGVIAPPEVIVPEIISSEIIAPEVIEQPAPEPVKTGHDLPATTKKPQPGQAHSIPIVQHSSSTQTDDERTRKIVDTVFERMSLAGAWGNQPEVPAKPPTKSVVEQTHQIKTIDSRQLLAESKKEMVTTMRAELPQLLRTEMGIVIRDEIVAIIRAEFESLLREISRVMDRLANLEPRLAKIEGAVDREIAINFPEGGFRVDAPITIPEREVRIAAPIKVEPPSVTFDEGAINIHFNKQNKAGRKVEFERDRHNNIQSAKIVDEPSR